jgi:hypothetical protein
MHPASADIWVVELHNGNDSRLTGTLIFDGLLPALDSVEQSWSDMRRAARSDNSAHGGLGGALVIVGNRNQHKFFSNGKDFQRSMHVTFSSSLIC